MENVQNSVIVLISRGANDISEVGKHSRPTEKPGGITQHILLRKLLQCRFRTSFLCALLLGSIVILRKWT
jgi:hypothetical protein